MDRILEYRVEDSDLEKTVNGILGKVLKQCMGLTPHEISHVKFTTDGITVLKKGDPDGNTVPVTVKDRVEAGVVSHPSHGHYRDSLANYLAGYYESKGIAGILRTVGRLDKDTSGIILYAKNAPAASRLFRHITACRQECIDQIQVLRTA